MSVFSDFRRCANALERLAATQSRQISSSEEASVLGDRLAQLELDRAQFESDCEGLLRKADGKLKAAANAEARERTMRRSHDEDVVYDIDDSEEVSAVDGKDLLPLDVPVALALNDKGHATRMKFS